MKTMLPLLLAAFTTLLAHGQNVSPAKLKAPRQTKYDKQVYDVTNNASKMSVTYMDSIECAKNFAKDADLNRWNAVQQAEERAKLPRGGYLKGTWARDTPGLASADSFVFLVEAPDGRELRRWTPEASVARPFSLMGVTVYTSLTLVPLPAPLPDGARVFVIDGPSQKRYEYVIHP